MDGYWMVLEFVFDKVSVSKKLKVIEIWNFGVKRSDIV